VLYLALAEAVRFELTNGCPLPVFKTGALNHSATPPFTRHRALHVASFGLGRSRLAASQPKNTWQIWNNTHGAS
jgi:hypothetical protein